MMTTIDRQAFRPVSAIYATIENTWPRYFHVVDSVVARDMSVDDAADIGIAFVDTEIKVRVFNMALREMQEATALNRRGDLEFFANSAEGLPMLLGLFIAYHVEMRLVRKAGDGDGKAALLEKVQDRNIRFGKIAQTCSAIISVLHARCHASEHHWEDGFCA
jgi:hypothetical protein